MQHVLKTTTHNSNTIYFSIVSVLKIWYALDFFSKIRTQVTRYERRFIKQQNKIERAYRRTAWIVSLFVFLHKNSGLNEIMGEWCDFQKFCVKNNEIFLKPNYYEKPNTLFQWRRQRATWIDEQITAIWRQFTKSCHISFFFYKKKI